jgi:hypothetical protein
MATQINMGGNTVFTTTAGIKFLDGTEQDTAANGNATSIQNVPVSSTPPGHNGELLIFDSTLNQYVPGDPLVQGLFPELTPTSGINPVLVSGKGADGNQHDISTDNSGNVNVNIVNSTVTISGSIAVSNFPSVQHVIVDSGTLIANIGTTGGLALDSTLTGGTAKVQLFDGTNVIGTVLNPVRIDPTGTTTQPIAGTVTANQGTSPWAIMGVVAVSNFPSTQPVSGTVTANQGTSPWVVSLASTTITGTVDVSDRAARLLGHVTVDNASIAVTGTFFQATQPVSLTSTTISGTVAVTQSTSPWVVSGTVTSTPSGTQNVNLTQLNSIALGSPSNYGTSPGAVSVQGVNAFITNTPAVTLASTTITGTVAVTGTFFQATQPVSGTVTANQGTSPWVVSLASTTITGTVAVTQSTSPWVVSGAVTANAGTGTFNIQSNASVNLAQLNGIALGSPSNYGTSPGAVSVQGVNAFITNTPAVTLASTTITGTVAVTQSTSPWVVSLASTTVTNTVAENLTQWASTALGIPTNFGTTPGAVIAGSVNASLFIGTTAAVASAAGVQKVGIVGNAGATLDATVTAGTAPTNGIAGLAVNNTTAPALTTGQSVAHQCDYQGSLFVKPYRRGQTVSKGTTCTTTAATTVLAAQAAGIFADITSLIITTNAVNFSVTLSDGTKSYTYNLPGGSNTGTGSQLSISFVAPLPASTAATAWTLTMSSANTVNVTIVAALQLAS